MISKENKQNINIRLPNNSNFPKFKDDIILMLSEIEEKLKNKYNLLETLINSKINAYDTKFITIENKLNLHTTNITKLIIELEKCSDIIPTEKKNSETLISHEIKINNLHKEISDGFYKYDRLFLDNLVIPGQIGEYCRFKNAKECFNFLISQTATLSDYKEKMNVDFKSFKEKCDEYFKKVHNDIETNKEVFMKYTTEKSEIIMDNCNKKINEYLDKIEEAKIENYSYAGKLKESSDCLINETNKLLILKNDITKNNSELKNKIQEINIKCLENISFLKIEVEKMDRKIQEIKQFINNIKFNKNLNPELFKNEIKNQDLNYVNSNNTLPNISNLNTNQDENLLNSNQDDNLNDFGLKIFRDNKIKPNPRKSLPKFGNKNFSLIIREGNVRNKINEFTEKKSKSKDSFNTLLPHKNSNNNNLNTIPKIKTDNHLIYKMIKNEKGSLMKTSSTTYFKPKKGI